MRLLKWGQMSLAEIIINQVSYPENRASDSLTRSYCFSHSPSSSVFCHTPETEVKWTCCSWNYLELSDLPWALASCPNCPLGPKARLFHSLSHLTCLLSQLTGGLPWGTFLVPPIPTPTRSELSLFWIPTRDTILTVLWSQTEVLSTDH